MNYLARAFAALLLTAAAASAQDPSRLYSQPTIPSDETLHRLNLKMSWRTFIPMDGRRDSFFSIQGAGDLILVQTRSGLISAVDPDTGRIRWQARVGRPYHVSVRLGFNSRSVYAVNDQTLYVLDRETGEVRWEYEMPSAVTAAPVADDEQIFLSQRGGTVSAFALPKKNPNVIAKAGEATKKSTDKTSEPTRRESEKESQPRSTGVRQSTSIGALSSATGKSTGTLTAIGPLSSALQVARGTTATGIEPVKDWSDTSGMRIEVIPLQTADTLFLVGVGGRIAGLTKGQIGGLRFEKVLTDDLIVVAAGQYKDEAYVASNDSNLYAVIIPTGVVKWRFTAGNPITRRPAVTDEDVYISTDQGGLRRLDRETGRGIWQNRHADRFVAMNPKRVYATDDAGRLLLLDRVRGTEEGTLNVRDFVFPIINDYTDRIYLAANDGLMVCLHDRDIVKPRQNKPVEVYKPEVKRRGGTGREKPADRPKPKPKADETETPEEKKGDEMEKKP
jgi:outer membrane protein assembly factor BamB